LNDVYRAFWEKQNELRDRRLADPSLRQAVMQELAGYQVRGLELRNQETLERLLEKADHFRQTILVEQASRAGRAPKADALQRHIVGIVQQRPSITARQLLKRLHRDQGGELIQEIDDGVVYFTQPDGSEEGRTKRAPSKGLKDRLSRAKKQVNSR